MLVRIGGLGNVGVVLVGIVRVLMHQRFCGGPSHAQRRGDYSARRRCGPRSFAPERGDALCGDDRTESFPL